MRPHASDAAIAALVFTLTVLTTGGPLNPVGLVAGGLACAALLGRRRFPVPVLVVSTLAAEFYLIAYLGHDGNLVLIAPMVAIYTVADTGERHHGLIVGGLGVLAMAAVHIAAKPSSPMGVDNLALVALGALAVAAGEAARNHRAYLVEAQARARQAESERDTEAARRVTEERLRIARDLHDVVGHHLALITVQAGVAAHVLAEPPEVARQALDHIGTASRAALAELTQTVGLLRQPNEPAAPTGVSGLAGLPGLLTSFRRSGLTVREEVTGPVRTLPAAADLAAYRVIQESLTNARRHAGPTEVTVAMAYRPDALRIVVDSAGAVRPGAAEGHGVAGMRERVGALGGAFQAGPRPEGGYRVSATLPLPAAAP
jgi:signal transduction histidine kinase